MPLLEQSAKYSFRQNFWLYSTSSMMEQGTGQYTSIACDIAFSRTLKAPLSMQNQGRTTPLGELQQRSITLLWTILSVNDGIPSIFGYHLTTYKSSSGRANSGRDECNRARTIDRTWASVKHKCLPYMRTDGCLSLGHSVYSLYKLISVAVQVGPWLQIWIIDLRGCSCSSVTWGCSKWSTPSFYSKIQSLTG